MASSMKEPGWLFASSLRTNKIPDHIIAVTQAAIVKLDELAEAAQAESGMQVLDAAPDIYDGPVNEMAALALTYEACSTWLWGQLWGGPDRQALLDVMAN